MSEPLPVTVPGRQMNPDTARAGPGLRFAAATHVGRIRELNEDSHLASAETGLWLVADGMGGHGGGDVASRIAAAQVADACRQGRDLVEAIREAHRAVIEAGAKGEGSEQMGSTIVALRTAGNAYEIAWVGDSRAYLWDGGLQPLTKDHSLVQERLDRQLITVDQAATDPGRGVITQCLGPANPGPLEVGHVRRQWHRHEQVLLCSDGLHEEVPQTALVMAFASGTAPERTVSRLIDMALDAGGPDNITAILVCAPDDAPKARTPGPVKQALARYGPRLRSLALGTAVGVLAATALVLIWLIIG